MSNWKDKLGGLKDATSAERIEVWCEALESGDYKQGRGVLRKGGRFCCLGVACDIHRQCVPGCEWVGEKYVALDETSLVLLSNSVRDWYGLEENDPKLKGTRIASVLNDTGTSFGEIARLIRKKYLEKNHMNTVNGRGDRDKRKIVTPVQLPVLEESIPRLRKRDRIAPGWNRRDIIPTTDGCTPGTWVVYENPVQGSRKRSDWKLVEYTKAAE